MDWETAVCQLERAQGALRAGNYEYVLALTEEILAYERQLPEIWALRAKAFAQLQRPLEALEAARRYAAANPDDASAQWELAQYAWRAGRLGLAQQAMEKTLEITGDDPTFLANYAWFLSFERGPRLAEGVARRAVMVAPDSSTAWAALGLAQLRLHRMKEAEASLKRALQLDPNDPCAQCATLFLLKEERENEKAVALAKILEDNPGAEPIADSIRREIARRMMARKLVERGVAVDVSPTPFNWRGPILWTMIGLTAAWMIFIFQAKDLWTLGICIGVPLIAGWILHHLLKD